LPSSSAVIARVTCELAASPSSGMRSIIWIAPADARRHFEHALAGSAGPRERAASALALSHALLLCNEPARAVAVLERNAGHASELSMRLAVELASAARFDSSLRPHWVAQAAVIGEHVDDSLLGRMCAANLASEAALSGSSAPEAARFARHALSGGHLLRERPVETAEFFLAAAALLYCDQLAEARAAADQALGDAVARGSATASSIAHVFRARVRLRSGDLLGSEADATASLEIAPAAQEPAGAGHARRGTH